LRGPRLALLVAVVLTNANAWSSIVGHIIMGQVTFTVNTGLSRITPTALVAKGRHHITMLTGNVAFPTPDPTLVVLGAACDTLGAAEQAYAFSRRKVEKPARDAAFAALKELVRVLAAYVQSKCNNEKELIISAGFDVRRSNEPLGLLPAPANVRALVTDFPGRLEVRWNGVRGRLLYTLQMTDTDPLLPAGWSPLVQTSKNRFVVDDLDRNKVYSFRLYTIGAAGASPASDTSSARPA